MSAHRPWTPLARALALVVLVFSTLPVVHALNRTATTIPTVESDHPYKNDENKFWTIANNSGQNAARIHFSRIELETGVDRIQIRDANDTLIQEITSSAPDGLWSDTVPGASIKVVLKTDGSGQFWGFAIDQLDPAAYTTLDYSPHPYPNSSTAVKTLVNNTAGATGTRVRFDRVELENGVDYIVIKDLNDVPYQWITGSYPNGLTSKAVPGAGIKVQLVTDGSGQAWGYNVAEIQTTPPQAPDPAPPYGPTLAESNHPYADNYTNTWVITNPDVNAVSSKVHFSRIDTDACDVVQVLDANDTIIQSFYERTHKTDTWSDYVPGRVVKIRLATACGYQDWGFRVDNITNAVANPGLVQSDHNYADNVTKVWTITNPDVNAVSSKVHFSRIDTDACDVVQVLDANDTIIQSFYERTHKTDTWSDYVPGRVVKIRLTTACGYQDWGFRVDNITNAVANPGLVQSDHNYGDNVTKVWTITNPNVNAVSSKVHFSRIDTDACDTVQVLGVTDTIVQTFGERTHKLDVWSDPVPGRIVKIKLTTACGYADWGFRVDAIEPSSDQAPPPAGFNALMLQVNAPGDVFLNGQKLFSVSYAGEYRIPLTKGLTAQTNVQTEASANAAVRAATPGDYIITINYVTGATQTIQATVGADGGVKVVYLPIVKQ